MYMKCPQQNSTVAERDQCPAGARKRDRRDNSSTGPRVIALEKVKIVSYYTIAIDTDCIKTYPLRGKFYTM